MEAKKMRKLIPVVGPLLAAVVAMVPIVGAIPTGILTGLDRRRVRRASADDLGPPHAREQHTGPQLVGG